MDNLPDAFLSLVAEDLISKFGTDLSDVTVVFPNIRASLFFNTYLYKHAKTPLWAPQYVSIEGLFENLSTFKSADNILLIGLLYEAYIKVFNKYADKHSEETLDEFFFFGEILLGDFDDVDKNLVNTKLIFSNLKDLDELKDDFSHLSDEQKEALQRRFKVVFQEESELKAAFWNIWNILGEVYSVFKEKLENKGIAYPGMIMRSVSEREDIEIKSKHIAFVGFNVLSKCEKQLFRKLKHKASFYWDYDSFYINTEAGSFIKENVKDFGSALDPSLMDSFLSSNKNITFFASPSESAQVSVINPWIKSLDNKTDFIKPDSSIILCNEELLPSTMHAIPTDSVNNVNITMGFPITLTAISSYIQVLTEMQTKAYRQYDKSFWYKYVLPVLRHPYTKLIFSEAQEVESKLTKDNIFYPTIDELKDTLIFTFAKSTSDLAQYLLDIIQKVGISYENVTSNNDPYNGLYQESVFRAYQVVNRLHGLIASGELNIEKSTFLRLVRKVLSSVKIPFHGEPVKGLQIMGLLETRTLDFKNVLLLSVNEGFMPANTNDNTFIPQFLRVSFGMSTIEHKDSIYAYYFYRIIQRAENITFVYNTDKTAMGKAEISRFLLQMMVNPDIKDRIKRFSIYSEIKPWKPEPIVIEKNENIISILRNKYDNNTNKDAKTLTPSALNNYINCSYKFYLEYVKDLREQDKLIDELDNSVFGSIFHQAAENLYREIGRLGDEVKTFPPFVVQKEHFAPYEEKNSIPLNRVVLRAFEKVYFKGRTIIEEDFNGEQIINFHVICKMMERLIRFDKRRAPFSIYGLEYKLREPFNISNNIQLNIGGIIDRLDEKDGSFYVLDYKTGGTAKSPKTIDDLFIANKDRAAHVFQTFVYSSSLIKRQGFNLPILPSVLYLQQTSKDDYTPVVTYNQETITDFRELNGEFEPLLIEKLNEIFNPEIPFEQTDIPEICTYCNFKDMCGK
ncbi:hypothetical protein M2138_000739 [Dysgonomonadaceae bacterium PH5-43]|nr:hypothetical protein [Dysgonomonadaceae bacterium PH5-43]